MIRHVRPAEDAGAICEIYNYYIKETVITFENNPIDLFTMQQRIERISSRFPYLVYEQNGKVLGYCYAATWRNRAAYNYTVEMTIYLDKEWTGRGIGYQVWHCMKNSDFARWRTFRKWATSSASGSMSASGNSAFSADFTRILLS